MGFGSRLYELRKQSALSQGDVGEKLGVSRQSVSLWETDQATPSIKNLIALSNLFGLSLDALINSNSDADRFLNLTSDPEYALTYEENRKIIYRRDYQYINDFKVLSVVTLSLLFLLFALFLFLSALFQTLEVARVRLITGNLMIIAGLLIYPLYVFINTRKRIKRKLEPSIELYKHSFHYTDGLLRLDKDYTHIDYYIDKKDYAILYLIDGKRLYLPKEGVSGIDGFLRERAARRTRSRPFWKSLKKRHKIQIKKG